MPANHQKFKLALSQARVVIERAFGILKGRWRILLGKVCLEHSYAADVVIACYVLHNICQERNEPEDASVLDPYTDGPQNENIPGSDGRFDGDEIRTKLVDFLITIQNDN